MTPEEIERQLQLDNLVTALSLKEITVHEFLEAFNKLTTNGSDS